jgi:hypothetical protein
MFQAHPTNPSVTRLLRNNLVRAVTPREIPNFQVDTKSNAEPEAPPVVKKKSTKKPIGGGE